MMTSKIFNVVLLASVLTLSCGIALADTTPTPSATATPTSTPTANRMHRPKSTKAPVKYTADQQTCINNARKTQQEALKTARDTFNAATKDAADAKQAAIKSAEDAFNAATKDATATKQAAIKDAQSIKDIKSRMAAIKDANVAYKSDPTVKSSEPTLQAAIKAANDAYQSDPTVQSAEPTLQAATKANRKNIIQQCTSSNNSFGASLFNGLMNVFQKSTSSLLNAFHF